MSSSVQDLAAAVQRGERRALSKAVTLIESQLPSAKHSAHELLSLLLPARKADDVLRLGISGPPGTGKSTLIELLGCELLRRGHRVSVVAVDPSSRRSGGSVLGDKTRMQALAADARAFVRPSPAQGVLGGVARHTEDVMVLCECGGYDRLVVETVGVGQSEVAVAGMVDMFILLLPPGAGDGLQGIKRGIMELADLVVVTKADGGLRAAAEAIAHDVDAALKVMRPRHSAWRPRVVTASSQDAEVAQKLLSVVDEFDEVSRKSGMRRERRRQQALASVCEHAKEEVFERLAAAQQVREQMTALSMEVCEGRVTSSQAADIVADAMFDVHTKFGNEV